MWYLGSPKRAFAHCWVGLWENHRPKLSVSVTQEDCTCRPELCNALSSCVEASEPKEMWHKISEKTGRPTGARELRELSGSTAHCASHGEWEVDFPTAWITKVGSGAPDLCLIFCTAFCNSHARREIMKRIIYPTLQISAWTAHVIPSQACSVGHSQPWDWTQELCQTTTPHLFFSHPAWGLDTGRVFTLKGRGVIHVHKGFISLKGKPPLL